MALLQAAEAAGKAESMAFTAAQLARTAHTKAALAAAISASQAYNQVIRPSLPCIQAGTGVPLAIAVLGGRPGLTSASAWQSSGLQAWRKSSEVDVWLVVHQATHQKQYPVYSIGQSV